MTKSRKETYRNVTESTSQRMRAVGARHTAPEMRVRRMLHAMGYRFRLHYRHLPGSPDIVLPRHKKIIFVHGCFWHGHAECKRATRPKNNAAVWDAKIDKNRSRDLRNQLALSELGWKVLVLWECEIKSEDKLVREILDFLA